MNFCQIFRKSSAFIYFSAASWSMAADDSPSDLEATIKSKNHENYSFTADIKIYNKSSSDINDWSFHFTQTKVISQVKGATLVTSQNKEGFYYTIEPLENATLAAFDSYSFQIIAYGNIKNISDLPEGAFLKQKGKAIRNVNVRMIGKSPLPQRTEELAGASTYHNIIPYPQALIPLPGPAFTLNHDTRIAFTGSHLAQKASKRLAKEIHHTHSILKFNPLTPPPLAILLQENSGLAPEGYELTIRSTGVTLEASTDAGFFYAIQSLKQILPIDYRQEVSEHTTLPPVTIKDEPRFKYRGIHLDVSRHFFTINEVKRLLKLASAYKINKFHWHLTDDEGWRVEIKAYPSLQEVGAFRGASEVLPPAYGSGHSRYGGFYTQEELRDVVAYALELGIEVIPEFELIGHARALIKSLPEKLVDPTDFSEYVSIQQFNDNTLSPCIESTFEVIETIIGEVADIFPSKYFHVGGDEIPDGVWNPEKSVNCAKLRVKHNLKTKREVQGYFAGRINAILKTHNKIIAGWEELGETKVGQEKDTLIYKWNPEHSDRLCAEVQNIVQATADSLYFDQAYSDHFYEPGFYWANYIDTKHIYNFDPIGPECSNEKQRIVGVQGSTFTETIEDQDRLDYMIFPRLLGLAELGWSDQSHRSWERFAASVKQHHVARLKSQGVKARPWAY